MMRVRTAVLAIVVLLCAVAAPRCVRAEQAYSIDGYRAELNECAAAVDKAEWRRGRDNELPGACTVLMARARITTPGKSFFVDPRYLLEIKKTIEARDCGSRDNCPATGREFAARVRYFSDAFPQLAESPGDSGFDAFGAGAREILARRAFRAREPWLSRLIPDSVKDWFRRLLGRLPLPSGKSASWMAYAIYALVAILAALVIGYIIYAVYGESGRGARGVDLPQDQAEESLPPAAIRKLAEQQARVENFREAARLLFLALIRSVEDSGTVRFLATKTNREFMGELGRSRTVSPELQSLNFMFEEVWYGMRPCSGQDYRRFESLYKTCLDQLR